MTLELTSKKENYHNHPNVRQLYYAIPTDLYLKHKDEIDERIDNAGLILIDELMDYNGIIYGKVNSFHKKAKPRKNAVPLTEDDKFHYLKLGCMKWVNR